MAAKLKDCVNLAKVVSVVEINLFLLIFFSNTLQLFALKNPLFTSQAPGCMSLCLKN